VRALRLVALTAVVAAFVMRAAPPAETGEVAGRVLLLDAEGQTAPAPGAVVWIPEVASPNPYYTPEPVITQKEKRFSPHVLAVARGTAVSFPNLDHIFHNVFSVSKENGFDLGLYRGGVSRETRFTRPGLVRVYCNNHPQMAAYVFVVDGGAFAVTDAEGRFRIGNVPAGGHVVRVWQEKGGVAERSVEVHAGAPAPLDVRLDAAGWKEPSHTRKDGRPYPPARADADRY
jgi:plastocyanin